MKPSDLVEEVMNTARQSRPDLQPSVIDAVRYAAWEWCKYVSQWNPANIRGFDGGEVCGRSGQLAMDIGGVRYTSELDFLATVKAEAFEEDFKTGWKDYTYETIADSFQFQSHAALIFHEFPEVSTVYIRCWNTRRNKRSPRVPFYRENVGQYEARIFQAIAVRARGELDCWPTLEKCAICPAASICPASDAQTRPEPEANLLQLIATEAKADALKKLLTAHVDATGKDIEVEGYAFGRSKPVSEKKKPVSLYPIKE